MGWIQADGGRVMAGAIEFTIGAEVSCEDGICGRVSRVVVDPLAEVVTHLVVEPEHRQGLGRLVPIDLADAVDGGIRLRCTLDDFEHLDSAEETQFVPGTRGYELYGPEQVLSWPYYRQGDPVIDPQRTGKYSPTVTVDLIPAGEVAIRRGAHVHATDGAIGQVQGLIVHADDDHVTHVLLQEGHLWGRKQVAIPISAVTGVNDGIKLSLSKREVEDLPPVSIAP